jgi:hypothetical protein
MSDHTRPSKGKSNRAQKPRIVERCIFWEASKPHTPLDYEHVFGDWLRKYVRANSNKHRMQHTVIGRARTPTSRKMTVHAGEPLLSNIKVVCKACNSGWMSRTQNAAKPFLTPLIEGRRTTLGTAAQHAIAAWCAMVTMTGDYLPRDPSAIAITQSERDWLRDHGTPPENWKIWIGDYRRQRGVWNHYVAPILDAKESVQRTTDRLAQPNTQSTTFVVGDLFVHTISSTGDRDLIKGWVWPLTSRFAIHLPQIFPRRESFIVWPPQSLTDFDVELISSTMERVIEGAARGMTGSRLF